MPVKIGASTGQGRPLAQQRARNITRDLERAVLLYGAGHRSELLMRTIAAGAAAYAEIGADIPRPLGVAPATWRQRVARLLAKHSAA